MYFFNVNALSRDLKFNRLTELDKAKYYFLTYILYAPTIALYQFLPFFYIAIYSIFTSILKNFTKKLGIIIELEPAYYILFLLPILISIIGIAACFNANKKGDNKNFLERMICLSLPITINLLIFTIFISLIIAIYQYDFFEENFKRLIKIKNTPIKALPLPILNLITSPLAYAKKGKLAKLIFMEIKDQTHLVFIYFYLSSILSSILHYVWLYRKIKFISKEKEV